MKDTEINLKMNEMDGGGRVGWIKLLSLKSLKRETRQSHTNLYPAIPMSLDLFSPSTCILSGSLSWDISRKTSSCKGDIHTYKVKFTLSTACLGDCAPCKTGNSLFSFQRCTHRAHIFLLLGRKSKEDCGSLCHVFFLRGLSGSVTVQYPSRRPPGKIVGAKQENAKVEVFMPKPGFQSLLWHNGDRSSHRNKLDHRDTKGKWKQTTDCRHKLLPFGLPSDNHPFLLFAHILALFLLQNDKHEQR